MQTVSRCILAALHKGFINKSLVIGVVVGCVVVGGVVVVGVGAHPECFRLISLFSLGVKCVSYKVL